jgi:hypothetical protein
MNAPPTTQQILARQKSAITPPRPTTPQTAVAVARPASTAVAAPNGRSAVQNYLDTVAPSAFSGRLVKFNKDGQFATSDTGDVIDENADFLALCDEVLIGWIKFNGENAPPDRIQGNLYDAFVMPARDTLGDLDQTQWETGLSGQPQDPWQHQMSVVLQQTENLEIFTFSTTSATGRRALGNLLHHYERLRRADANLYPVVRLKPGGFQHKDPRVGWVAVPLLLAKRPRTRR